MASLTNQKKGCYQGSEFIWHAPNVIVPALAFLSPGPRGNMGHRPTACSTACHSTAEQYWLVIHPWVDVPHRVTTNSSLFAITDNHCSRKCCQRKEESAYRYKQIASDATIGCNVRSLQDIPVSLVGLNDQTSSCLLDTPLYLFPAIYYTINMTILKR